MARSHTLLLTASLAGLLAMPLVGTPAPAQTAPASQNLPASAEIPADAAAQISKVTPAQAAAASQVTVQVAGANFSAGAYVSFSTPDVRVISTRRLSATELEATLAVRPGATPGTATLYVSNPAGAVAQTSFQIVPASTAPPPAPCGPVSPFSKPLNPACAVDITSVKPLQASAGSQLTLKIQGKNFAPGAQVSFSNPGIRVLGTEVTKGTELSVKIQIAADAAPGVGGLFVANPDETEAESTFEVTGGTAAPAASQPAAASSASGQAAASAEQKFEVYNLGDAATIFKNPSKSQGTLIVGGGKLRYEEAGKVVFNVAAADIQEIGGNVVFGLNTGTFHIILKSSKTYNFASTSLRPADTQAVVDALHRALQ
jgi:hypothetical protein